MALASPDTDGIAAHRHQTQAQPATPRLPEWLRVALAPLALVVAIFAPQALGLVPGLAAAVRGWPLAGQLAVGISLFALTTVCAVLLVTALARFVDHSHLRDYGWRWDRRVIPSLTLGLGLAVAVALPVTGLAAIGGWLRPVDDASGGMPLWGVIVQAIALAFLLQAIPEELIFRGYLLRTLRSRGRITPVWMSAILFAALHLLSSSGQEGLAERFLYLALPFGFAVLAGALRLVTGSIWAAIGVHGGIHVASLIAAVLGWGDGPVVWAVTGTLLTVIGATLLSRWRRCARAL